MTASDNVSSPINSASSLLAANMFSVLVQGPSGCGKTTTLRAAANVLGLHLMIVDCYDLVGVGGASNDLRRVLSEARECVPCVLVLENVMALEHSVSEKKDSHTIVNILGEELEKLSNGISHPVLLVGTAAKVDSVSIGLRGWFRHEITIQAPDNKGRQDILRHILHEDRDNIYSRERLALSPNVSVADLSRRTASFLPSDLTSLMSQASLAASHRVMKFMRYYCEIELFQ